MNHQELIDLFIKKRRHLLAIAKTMMFDNPSNAEDMLQDVFISVMNNSYQFTGDESGAMGWFIVILRNAVRTNHRRSKWDGGELEEFQHPTIWPTAFAEIQLEEILHFLSRERNGDLLVRLSMGEDYHEVAQDIGIPDGTVKSRSFRVRERLLECFPEELA